MTSYLLRSSQKTQFSPSRKNIDDVFSEFRTFRNETKRKVESTQNRLLLESPSRSSQANFQPYLSSNFISTKGSTSSSQPFPMSSGVQVSNTRHASNISPQKKSTVGIQRLSPQKSYIYRENLHEACQQHQHQNHKQSLFSSKSNANSIQFGLENLQRELKEISQSKHYNQQVNSARTQPKKNLANLSPVKRNNDHRLFSPTRGSANKLFTSYQASNLQQPSEGLSSLYTSSQFNSSPLKRRNSYQPRLFNISSAFNPQGKVVSYSPSKQSQRLFSPNRLLKRINSPPQAQFQEFEFIGTQDTPQLNFRPTSPLTSKIGLQSLDIGSSTLRRSSSASGNNNFKNIFQDVRSKVKNQGLSSNLSPNSQFARNLANLNNSSYLSPNRKNTGVFKSSQNSFLVDKKANDLGDYLRNLNNSQFNSLSRNNVDSLLKLSSVISSKVKNSNYQRGGFF